jgi:hypothetical protein
MDHGRKMLLQTLVGHLALLESAHPRKAKTAVARRTRRYVKLSLRKEEAVVRRWAA